MFGVGEPPIWALEHFSKTKKIRSHLLIPYQAWKKFLVRKQIFMTAKCPQNHVFPEQMNMPWVTIFFNIWDIFSTKKIFCGL